MFKFKKNIKIAHQVLLLHMNKIQTIQEWANYMDYNSARVFAREFKKEFNIPPNKVIIEERLGCVRGVVAGDINLNATEISMKAGLSTAKSLYNFLRRNGNITLTSLRQELNSSDNLTL